MKYLDIIELLRTNPSEPNLAAARRWLEKRKQSTKSTTAVAVAVLRAKDDADTLKWIGDWMVDKNWAIASSAVYIRSFNIHDWLTDFASKHPTNQQASQLWSQLLINYQDANLIERATTWFVDHADNDENVLWVASHLIALTNDSRVRAKAKELGDRFPDSVALIPSLVEHVADDHSKELGRRLLYQIEPDMGSLVCSSLVKVGEFEEAKRWLRMNWEHKSIASFLEHLIFDAPVEFAPLAFEWLDEHPRFSKGADLFRTINLSRSQELFDSTWNWLQRNLESPNAPAMLALFVGHGGELTTPEEAVDYAEKWVSANLENIHAYQILLGVIGERDTPTMRLLAREWLSMHSGEAHGKMLLNLIRKTSDTEFLDRAKDWIEQFPDSYASHAIIVELVRKEPGAFQQLAERTIPKMRNQFGQMLMLQELVKAGDEVSIKRTKKWLFARVMVFRHSHSEKCQKTTLMCTLLKYAPRDQDVIELATQWLADGTKDFCEAHLKQVQVAFDEAAERNS